MTEMAIRRVFIGGWKSFVRGGAVSFATVLIMTATLGIIASLIFVSGLLNFTLDAIRDKVDITVYIAESATEEEIFNLRDKLLALPEVERVVYTNREEALERFRARNADNQLTLQALDELGGNPLRASLAVKAQQPSDYESVVTFLEATPALSAGGDSIIDRINYVQNKEAIDRLSLAITATKNIGLAVVLFFALLSILIAFATIRLAIFTARDEIAVMQLVGASMAYVRGPFVVTGIITGILGSLIVLILFFPISWYAGVKTESWLAGFNFFAYYGGHLIPIALTLIGTGVILGALASFFAIRKYLKA